MENVKQSKEGSLGFRFEFKYDGIHTISFVSRRWAIVKNMSEVRATPAAIDFNTLHPIGVIILIGHSRLANGFKKARPSAFARKFAIGFKQGIAAYSAVIGPSSFKIPVFTRKGPFCSFLTGYVIDIVRENFLPLRIGYVQHCCIRVRVIRVLCRICCRCILAVTRDCSWRAGGEIGKQQEITQQRQDRVHNLV